MAENQKNSVKKSFWQRNLFLIIIILIILVFGGGYLYKNNILNLSLNSTTSSSPSNNDTINKEPDPIDLNNKQIQDKVDRLENLILDLAKNIQSIPQPSEAQPEPEPQEIVLSNDEAYELIISINQIITNIDQQQLRNKQVQKLQNKYLFFHDKKFEELLTLPDYTYLLQQLSKSEQSFVQNEVMKNSNIQWLKKIISNIFEINIAKNKTNPLALYINAILNRQYTKAIVEYNKLNPNQKKYFKITYELTQLYNENQIFLENMI